MPIFGLSGPEVRFAEVKDLDQQVEVCTEVINDLKSRYTESSLALIYCQYFNPSFKRTSNEAEILRNHQELKQFCRFASATKGLEFYAGVVFVSASFLGKDMDKAANSLRINTLYVALTRFRSEVTVVFPQECAVIDSLRQLNVTH